MALTPSSTNENFPASDRSIGSPTSHSYTTPPLGTMYNSVSSQGNLSAQSGVSAQEMKEWCIDAATENAWGNTLAADLDPAFLSHLACLDTEHEEFNNIFATARGQDMPTALALANNDHVHAQHASARVKWLNSPAQSELKAKVEKLMDDELRFVPNRELENETLESKVLATPTSMKRADDITGLSDIRTSFTKAIES